MKHKAFNVILILGDKISEPVIWLNFAEGDHSMGISARSSLREQCEYNSTLDVAIIKKDETVGKPRVSMECSSLLLETSDSPAGRTLGVRV